MNLILYLSLGYPNLNKSIEIAQRYVEAGCDVIEADFPASDPYLDSPFIQSRMKGALSAESDYSKYMETIETIHKNHPHTRFIILAYEQTILKIGKESFLHFMKRNGFQDLIYVGKQEHPEIKEYLMDNDIRLSSFVRYHLPQEDLDSARKTNGFVYLQAKSTGEVHDTYQNLDEMISFLRKEITPDRMIYCGVGISSPDDVARAKDAGADGVFVGSRVLKLHDEPVEMERVIKELKIETWSNNCEEEN